MIISMQKNPQVLKLVISNALKKSWTTAFFIFLNIFVWKNLQDFQVLIVFNLCYMVFHLLWFIWLSKIAKNYFRREILYVGLFIFASVFLLMSIFPQDILEYIYIVWSILWFTNAMYWVTFNTNYFEMTSYENRWYYSWLRASFWTIWWIITPVIIWWIISINYEELWYQIAFLLGAIMFFFSAFFGNIEVEKKSYISYKFFETFWNVIKNKKILFAYICYGLTGFAFSNILLETLLPMIIYTQVQVEYLVGWLVSIFSILSVFATYIIWKYVSYKNYKYCIVLSWLGYIICMISMLIWPEYIYIFFAILSFLFMIYSVPMRTIMLNLAHELPDYKYHVSENQMIVEMFIMAGRIGALVMLYFFWDLDAGVFEIVFYAMIIALFIASLYYWNIWEKKKKIA